MTHTDEAGRKRSTSGPHPGKGAPGAAEDSRAAAGARAEVSPSVARQIDENLKRLYRQQIEQDLPPELEALVARLRGQDVGGANGGSRGGRS